MLYKSLFKRYGENLYLFRDDDFVVDQICYDRSRNGNLDDGQVIQVMFQFKKDYQDNLEEENSEGYVVNPYFTSPMCWIQDSFVCKCKKIGCYFAHELYDGRSSP